MDLSNLEEMFAKGERASAELACIRLLNESPQNAALWELRGRISIAANDFDNAESYFTRAMELDGDAPMPRFGLAKVNHARNSLGKTGKYAVQALQRGLCGEPGIMAQVWSTYALFAQGRRETAIESLASFAPWFKAMSSAALKQPALARDAMSCAACANDIALAERVFGILEPECARTAPLACAPVATIGDWCRQHGAPWRIVDEPYDVTLEASSHYSQPYAYRTDPVVMASIPEGRWVPGWDLAIAPDGTVLEDSGYLRLAAPMTTIPHFHFREAQRVIHFSPHRHTFIDATALLLSGPTNPNFGHWMIDFLPRLRALDLIAEGGIKLAVPEDVGAKHVETLALWGLAEDDLIRCRLDTLYSFRTLHVLSLGQSMPPNPIHVKHVRERFYAPARPSRRQRPKRIYLSRTSVGTRMIANAQEFETFLTRAGFVSMDMADLSIAEQQDYLCEAEIMLGAYGTNLLALYFAPPGCAVIAMMDKPENDPVVAHTCALLGMRHHFFVCPPAATSGKRRHSKDVDLVVDCSALEQRIAEIEATASAALTP